MESCSWMCIHTKEGPTVLSRNIIKVPNDASVGDVIGDLDLPQSKNDPNNNNQILKVVKIMGYKNDPGTGIAPDTGMTLQHDMPVATLLNTFYVKHMVLYLSSESVNNNHEVEQPQNALDLLVKINRSYDHLPPELEARNMKVKLQNKLLELFRHHYKIGFRAAQVQDIGIKILSVLTDVLWYIDPYVERLEARSIKFPDPLAALRGYRNLKSQHKKIPMLKLEELKIKLDSIAEILMLPWFMIRKFKSFRDDVTSLHEALFKYTEFLTKQNVRTAQHHASEEPVRGLKDNWSFKILEGNDNLDTAQTNVYKELYGLMEEKEMYSPVSLLDLEPTGQTEKRKWRNQLKFPYPCAMYTYSHGNFMGNMIFIWKLPDSDKRDPAKDIKIMNDLQAQIPKYATRAMRQNFIEIYSKAGSISPAILRNMYHLLTGYEFSAENTTESSIDERVCTFLLEADDPELIYDLRANNGKHNDPKYDQFWEALGKYLEGNGVVDDRRHGETLYMPMAISLRDLREQVLKTLPEGTQAPSISWIRLNFQPTNPYTKAAINYTGRFEVKNKVQQRLIRAKHEDSAFCYHQFNLMKCMAVQYIDYSTMQCLDDKAIIPIGEPDCAVSTGVRIHHGCLVANNQVPQALDHDYHIAGIVPSVLFHVNIPQHPRDSFYNGEVYVTVKEKVFEPSSPIRHAAESTHIMREKHCAEDGISCASPILFRYTDGGPDHRTTYRSVQIAALLEFIALDLDMIVAVRTAPNQSYNNPAERVMSLLNLALQNASHARDAMPEHLENRMKSLKSLKAVRREAERNPALKKQYAESMATPMQNIKDRFSRLTRKEEKVQVFDAADQKDINAMKELLKVIDEAVDVDNLQTDLSKYPKLEQFFQIHTRQRHYSFQIKKCGECSYCVLNPWRIPDDVSKNLYFLPDPVKGSNDEYLSFDMCYGTDTTDSDRPSLKSKNITSEADKAHKSLLIGGKVRAFITCFECGKRRVIYSSKRLSPSDELAVLRVQEELLYSCGSALFPEGVYQDKIIVRQGITCASPVETQYYADITQTFDPVCFYCSDTETFENEIILQLKKEWGIVRPICETCYENGNAVVTRQALKVGQKGRAKKSKT